MGLQDPALQNPDFPQSNGQAERSVQTVKRLFKKAGGQQNTAMDFAEANKIPFFVIIKITSTSHTGSKIL